MRGEEGGEKEGDVCVSNRTQYIVHTAQYTPHSTTAHNNTQYSAQHTLYSYGLCVSLFSPIHRLDPISIEITVQNDPLRESIRDNAEVPHRL